MKTKAQKKQAIDESEKLLKESGHALFVDFSGIGVEDMRELKKALRESGARMKVIKKKLLRVAFQNLGIDFNPEQFDLQLATIFAQPGKDISEVASPVYKFYKDKEKQGFKILGMYDLSAKQFADGAMTARIGQLPPREVLLAQFVGMLAMPIKMFMYVLEQKAKKS